LLDLLYCELLKLKHSKLTGISLLGVMATPVMMLTEALQTHVKHPGVSFTLTDIYRDSLLYTMLLINMMIYVAVAAYLFSREYTENTLKTILPIPISRTNFLIAKFLVFYIWVIILTFFTWAGIFLLSGIYHVFIGMGGFSLSVALKWLFTFFIGNTLLFFVLSPVAFIAEQTKGLATPMIAAAVIMMGNAALCNQDIGALYPWTAIYFFLDGKVQTTGYPIWLSAAIILTVSLIGFLASFQYFKKEDLK